VLHTLTSYPKESFKVVSKVGFIMQVLEKEKHLYLHAIHKQCHYTRGIDTDNYTDKPLLQNPMEAGGAILQTHEQKNSSPISLSQFFPPTSPLISLSIHAFLHPSPSKACSQQSGIEFHYSLVMQHFKGERTACV